MKSLRSNGGIIGALKNDYTADSGVFDLDLAKYIAPPPSFQVVGVGYNVDAFDYTCDLPTGLQVGDLMILLSSHDNDPFGSGTPTGWTNIALGGLYDAPSWSVNYRFYTGSEGSEVTVAYGGLRSSSDMVVGLRGVNTVAVAGAQQNSGAVGMPQAPAISATAGRYVIICGSLDDDKITGVTAPSGYTMLGQNPNGLNATYMMAYKEITASGTETPAAFAGTGDDQWVGNTFEVYLA